MREFKTFVKLNIIAQYALLYLSESNRRRLAAAGNHKNKEWPSTRVTYRQNETKTYIIIDSIVSSFVGWIETRHHLGNGFVVASNYGRHSCCALEYGLVELQDPAYHTLRSDRSHRRIWLARLATFVYLTIVAGLFTGMRLFCHNTKH